MALNASNHLAMDAIIDFAAGQTFGAFSYPDATTTSKGIVQVDPVGGLAVAAGVASLAATGVVAGTYPKVTVDAKGRVTGGAALVSGDLPAHTHVATDIVSGALPFTIQKAGTAVGTRRALNLIEGANVTLTVADDAGNDRVNVTVAAASGATTHNLLSATHPDTVAAAPVLGDLIAANGTPAWARLAGNTTASRKFLRQTGTGTVSAAPAWDSLLAGDLPAHTHAESDVTSLATDLTNRPVKGTAWAVSKAAVINSSGQLDGAAGTVTDCVLVNGSSTAKADTAHTHAATDIVSGTLDNARTSGTASATASTLVLRDGSGGASFGYVAANNQWAYLDSHFQSFECGAFQTVGGPFENMAKYSEDFTVATWDKNGGSCSATANSTAAPDGNATADTITAVTATPIVQQQIAGLASGGQYTFYVWAKVASGTKQVSIAIVDNAYAGYLAGPTSITLTTAWQRFKITGTLAGGQTGLWIVVRQFAGNGDNWTSGAIYLWGACLQQGNDPKAGYARTWASQTAAVAAGIACGATVIAAKDNAESPLRIYGPGSNLADHRLVEVTAGGELILAGGTGNGYRLAELMGATNPSGWSGVLKVKNACRSHGGLHPPLLEPVIPRKDKSNEVDAGPYPASEPARAPGRAAGRRGVYSRDLGGAGQARPRCRRGEAHRTEARDGERDGADGVEPRALDPAPRLRVLRSGDGPHQSRPPDLGLVHSQCGSPMAKAACRCAVPNGPAGVTSHLFWQVGDEVP